MRFGVIAGLFIVLLATQALSQEEDGEKHEFQAEVTRMMKLIINSLYTNKEIFLRELISNASDALDKIRVLALTSKEALDSGSELEIRIKADDTTNTLHITDTGIGMTRQELINNLGTIAKSGTSEFLKQNLESSDQVQLNDLIGQFGVGFYSSFLVADKVVVSSKANDDPERHLWISNSSAYTVAVDKSDSEDKLKRGTTVTLYLKEEAKDFLKQDTLQELIKKYSQFINFPIYLWTSKTVQEEVPVEGDDEEDKPDVEKNDDATVEEEEQNKEKKAKTKKVDKTVWEWKRINVAKPIWQRKPIEVTENEYNEFYKSITRDYQNPLARTHFTAEGELTFKSLLFVPKQQPSETFNKYGTKSDNIKLYVRRVFISDEFNDLMPNYLSFVRGVVDSDDLPLNVGRETLQQHKLLKVIKKKLVRKTLDMIKKIDESKYTEFWKEYSTNLKLGVIEDQSNRNRIAKLLRFHSSKTGADKWTSLSDYVKDMQSDQEQIYYIAGSSFDELSQSPFVESALKRGYEVLYLTDAVDEYCLSNLPEFDGKKFQNVAKEGLVLGKSKSESQKKAIESKFKPLVGWLKGTALKDKVQNVVLSERLSESPAALVAPTFGWTGNMERLAKSNAHSKSKDMTRDYYLSQKKILEINPHHPIIKELLKRVALDEGDSKARQTAELLFETATIRSGYMLQDTEEFGKRVEKLMRVNLDVPEDAPVEEETVEDDAIENNESGDDSSSKDNNESKDHEEL